MILKSLLALAVALPLLSACDLVDSMHEMVSEQTADMTIYMSSAVELLIDENQVGYVHGFDECPIDSVSWLFGYSESVEKNSCIKIEPQTESIKVRVINDRINLVEVWSVSKLGEKYHL